MKRFTDTAKWEDKWFRKLPLPMKAFWIFLCDRCDLCGVWKVDLELAEFIIGAKLPLEEIKAHFGDRIQDLPGDRWFISKFIEFQYGDLSPDCRPHQAVIKGLNAYSIGYAKGILTLPDRVKDKDKDQDKEKDQDQEGGCKGENKSPETLELSIDDPKTENPKTQTDAEWLESLKSNRAYEGIDIDVEFGKAKTWCDTNRRKCSRKFFVNWINRAERPMNGHEPEKTVTDPDTGETYVPFFRE